MRNKRQDIVSAANRLLYTKGFAAVGIDAIVNDADVALGTLYKHFASRSDVVVAALRQRHDDFIQALEDDNARRGGRQGVLRIFDTLGDWAETYGGNGCFFLRAASDYPQDIAIQEAATEHKRKYLELIASRVVDSGFSNANAKMLAPMIFVLLEGAVAAAYTLGDKTAIAGARKTAALLLAATDVSCP